MPQCSIIGCRTKSAKKPADVTLHRLPTVAKKRNAWLELIGVENIDFARKNIFICSLHFEDSNFNQTMNIVKLRDDALPSKFLPSHRSNFSGPLTERGENEVPSSSALQYQDLAGNKPNFAFHLPSTSTQDALPPAISFVSGILSESDQNNPANVDSTIFSTQSAPAPVKSVCSDHQNEHKVIPKHIIPALPKTMTREHQIIKKLKEKCNRQAKKIKRLNETVRRHKKKIAQLSIIVTDLKQRNLLNLETAVLIEGCAGPQDFLKRQIAKSKGLPLERQYSEEIRKFAITLHFFSPKAYDFVRRTYNTCLPHPRTLSNWYQRVDAEPGFCAEAFETLKTHVQQSNYPVVCALTFDEMAIRKSLCWDARNKTYAGRVSFGATIDNDDLDIANQCLVFLVTCINGRWKLPLGYFFITSLTGEQKSSLLEMCIKKCNEVGITLVSVTCDAPSANFTMFSIFGCDLLKDQNVTSFNCGDSKIHIFIDPCHAIKLIRNSFGELRVFYDASGRKIDFIYLERLLDLQESEGLHMATKITKSHVMFSKQKMKVRLATQLLSNSVADALEFCETKLKIKEFDGSAATVNFIRLLNDVFDVLNSQSVRPPGWKKAMCPENIGLVDALFDGAIGYLQNLKLPSGELLIHSSKKRGFIGLIVDMKSSLELYRHLVEDTKMLKYLPLYKISQDHVELFFSAVRARGGFNDNPNAVQFKAAFKRLLIRAEIRDVGVGNCIPLEQVNILTCSSKTNPITTINNLTAKSTFVELEESDSDLYDEFIGFLISSQSGYSENVVEYIAGFVARKLSKEIKCEVCVRLLYGVSEEYSQSLITLKSHGGLIYPSKSLKEILNKSEKLLKSVFSSKEQPEKYYLHIFKFFIEYFSESDNFLESGNMEHDSTHKYLLIKSIIKTYMDIRYKYFGKKSTETISFRNYFNKLILFRNQ